MNLLFLVQFRLGAEGILLSTLVTNVRRRHLDDDLAGAPHGPGASTRHWLRELRRFGMPYQVSWAGSFLLTFGDRFFLQAARGASCRRALQPRLPVRLHPRAGGRSAVHPGVAAAALPARGRAEGEARPRHARGVLLPERGAGHGRHGDLPVRRAVPARHDHDGLLRCGHARAADRPGVRRGDLGDRGELRHRGVRSRRGTTPTAPGSRRSWRSACTRC